MRVAKKRTFSKLQASLALLQSSCARATRRKRAPHCAVAGHDPSHERGTLQRVTSPGHTTLARAHTAAPKQAKSKQVDTPVSSAVLAAHLHRHLVRKDDL